MKKSLSYLCVAVMTACVPLIGCGPARTARPPANTTVPTPRVSSVTPASDTYRVAPELSQRVAQIPGISNAVTLVNGNIAYVAVDTVNPPGTTNGASGRTIGQNSVARDGSTAAGPGNTSVAVGNTTHGTVNNAANVGRTASDRVGRAASGVGNAAAGAGNGVGGVVSGAGNITGRALSGVGNALGAGVGGVGNALGAGVGGVGNALGAGAGGVGNAVGGAVSGAANLAGGLAAGVGNVAGQVATGVGNATGAVVSGTGNAVGGLTGGNNATNAAPRDAYTNTTTYVSPRVRPRPDRAGTYIADQRGMVISGWDRNRTAAPARPQVYQAAGVDPRLQQRVSDTIRSANPSIMFVYVTDDPNAFAKLQSTGTTPPADYRPLIDQIFPSAR